MTCNVINVIFFQHDTRARLIRVGERLHRAESLNLDVIHPIILELKHHVTELLIKEYDNHLLNTGPEQVFSEIRRKYWILQGMELVKRHQYSSRECQRWQASSVIPPTRLPLYKLPFSSTGVDCFGPYLIKVGQRTEKQWGIIFKCMTTSCVHLDLLHSMDTDDFLMTLWRFIAHSGKPFEILADQGTNFGDPDPITPNLLLMGQRDASLPQAIYASIDLLGRWRWRHSQILADHFGTLT